jgi:hypothetical protein
VKADERNYNGEHIEHLAKYSSHGEIIHVINYPKRRDERKLRYTDGLSVAGPHSKRATCLRNKEKHCYPPKLAEDEEGYERGRGKANFHYNEIYDLFTSVAECEDDTAKDAENIEKHSRIRAEQGKLQGERDTATHLKEEVIAVFLALIRYERTEHTYISYKLYRGK